MPFLNKIMTDQTIMIFKKCAFDQKGGVLIRAKVSIYTAEYRASAVKLANESDKPITQVAKDLGINVNTLHTWISKYSRPKENDKTARTDEPLYDELKRLKKEVARLTEERDLLKKAAAYFAMEQR